MRLGLPVGDGGVEDLVGDVLHHLRYEFFLHGGELLRGIVFGGCRELSLEVVGVLLVVDETYVDGHSELYLAAVSVAGDAFVELVEGDDLACELQVAVLLHLSQFRLVGVDFRYPVLEDALHRCPDIGAADGEVVYLDGLGGLVVDAGSVEAIADGTSRDEHREQEREEGSPYIRRFHRL